MQQAIRLIHPGKAGALQMTDWAPRQPGKGELRIRHDRVGVNFIDSYYRTGLYPLAEPCVPGVEGVGRIEALGEGVSGFDLGQRVAYCAQPGAFATTRLLPAWRALPLPDHIGSDVAAASMLRGMTAHMLLSRVFPVVRDSRVLVHAAAGGLGGLLTQWAKALGAFVIGTVSTTEKAAIARWLGADHVIVGRASELADEVDAITDGQGADYAIDGIGGTRLRQTMASVRADGTVASIGQAAGSIPHMSVAEFSPRRTVRFARPSIMAFAADPKAYREAGEALLAMLERGIAVEHDKTYPLAQAAAALSDLESGDGTGAKLLEISS